MPRSDQRKGLGCLAIMLALMAAAGLLGFLLLSLWGPSTGDGQINEVIESQRTDSAGKRVVIIEASGVMLEGGGLMQGSGLTARTMRLLERARKDERVKAVLLRLDTPGGSITEADLLRNEIQKLQDAGKPLVVLMGDMCASGGYYAASAAQEIWALPTSITGSIGVVMQGLNLSQFLARHGVEDSSVASGPNKTMLSPTRPIDPQQQALAQEVVDELHQRFIELVAAGRKLELEAVRAIADGRILTARAAHEAKLIDGIAYRDAVLDRVKQLAGAGPFDVVRYEDRPSLVELLRGQLPVRFDATSQLIQRLGSARALVLYDPLRSGP